MNLLTHAREIFASLMAHEAAILQLKTDHPELVGTPAFDLLETTVARLHRALNRLRLAMGLTWDAFKALMLAGNDAEVVAALSDDPPTNPQSGGTNKDDDDEQPGNGPK